MLSKLLNRSAGILLHPTSLPSNEGIGTLGKTAYNFIDWLHSAHIRLWQVLPLGPTGYGDSPYAAFSSFAGNPLLIDLETLLEQGYLTADDIKLPEYLSTDGNIDFGSVVYWKIPLLKKAASAFLNRIKDGSTADTELKDAFRRFQKANKHLDDYALFMSIKEVYDAQAAQEGVSGKLWNNYWPKALACRDMETLKRWAQEHRHEIDRYKVIQFFFFEQWTRLRQYANEKGISIIGDIPIFVAPDSSDVWANQKLFQLDENGVPTAVAGVPPDYFSATGQLWGNPLYNGEAMNTAGGLTALTHVWNSSIIFVSITSVVLKRIGRYPSALRLRKKANGCPAPIIIFLKRYSAPYSKRTVNMPKVCRLLPKTLGLLPRRWSVSATTSICRE